MELELTPDTFRALARSSSCRWSTMQLVWQERGQRVASPLRAWIRRPHELRIEDLVTGAQSVHTDSESGGSSGWTVLTASGSSTDRPVDVPPPPPAQPTLRPDGLVSERPWIMDDTVPFFMNYFWVAVLDPYELGGGFVDEDGVEHLGTTIEVVQDVVIDGRRVWDALVRQAEDYEPRCSCCPILDTGTLESRPVWPPDPTAGNAAETYVRLDVQTGIVVHTRHHGGQRDGHGVDITLEAVDAPMGDELFVATPSQSRRRRMGLRRSP